MGISIEFDVMTGRKLYAASDGKRFNSLREAELYERQRSTRSQWKTTQFSNAYGAGALKIDEQLDKLSREIDRLTKTAELVVTERNMLREENKKLEGELADRDELMESEFTRLEKAVQGLIEKNTGLQEQVSAWQEDSEEKGAEIARVESILSKLRTYTATRTNFIAGRPYEIEKALNEILDEWSE